MNARLKAVRLKKSLSLRDLAKLTGLSASAICLIEQDKRSPTIYNAMRLAMALGVRASDLWELQK